MVLKLKNFPPEKAVYKPIRPTHPDALWRLVDKGEQMKNHFLADYLQKAKETPLALNIVVGPASRTNGGFCLDYRAYRLRPLTQKSEHFTMGSILMSFPN